MCFLKFHVVKTNKVIHFHRKWHWAASFNIGEKNTRRQIYFFKWFQRERAFQFFFLLVKLIDNTQRFSLNNCSRTNSRTSPESLYIYIIKMRLLPWLTQNFLMFNELYSRFHFYSTWPWKELEKKVNWLLSIHAAEAHPPRPFLVLGKFSGDIQYSTGAKYCKIWVCLGCHAHQSLISVNIKWSYLGSSTSLRLKKIAIFCEKTSFVHSIIHNTSPY